MSSQRGVSILQWVYKTHSSFCSVNVVSHAFSKLWTYSSIFPHSDFFNRPQQANPLELLESVFFIRDSFPVHLQIAAAFQTAHLLLEPWFRFLIRGPSDKRGREEAEEKGEAREKILIECSPPDNEFSQTIQMYLQNAWVIHYSRFWSVTMDLRNEWWYLFADFISLILLIPLACVPLLIRK